MSMNIMSNTYTKARRMRDILFTLILLTTYQQATAQEKNTLTIPPYNDVHTEGYKGPVKRVIITNYEDPKFEANGLTVKEYKQKSVIDITFNADRFIKTVDYYTIENGQKILVKKERHQRKDQKQIYIAVLDSNNKPMAEKRTTWVNDTLCVTNEYEPDRNVLVSNVERHLNNNYQITTRTMQYLSQSGQVQNYSVMYYGYGKNGVINSIKFKLYNSKNELVIENTEDLIVNILKRDKYGNTLISHSKNPGSKKVTLVMELVYEYYE